MSARATQHPVLDSVPAEEYADFEAKVTQELAHIREKVDLTDRNVRGVNSRVQRLETKLNRLLEANGLPTTD